MNKRQCDRSCRTAREPECECVCGGANHGRAWKDTQTLTGEQEVLASTC